MSHGHHERAFARSSSIRTGAREEPVLLPELLPALLPGLECQPVLVALLLGLPPLEEPLLDPDPILALALHDPKSLTQPEHDNDPNEQTIPLNTAFFSALPPLLHFPLPSNQPDPEPDCYRTPDCTIPAPAPPPAHIESHWVTAARPLSPVVGGEGSGGWHPVRRCARQVKGGGAGARVSRSYERSPAFNPASGLVLNPALSAGHPGGHPRTPISQISCPLVRADQAALF